MTEKHINFDLSKTDNVASDVNQVNERNILCNFCNNVLIWQGTAIKKSHQVSQQSEAVCPRRLLTPVISSFQTIP